MAFCGCGELGSLGLSGFGVKDPTLASSRSKGQDINGSPDRTYSDSVGGLIIRIGFRGILYYNCNKEPPK